MSTVLSIADAGELVAHTLATLKAVGYAASAMIPGHQNPSNEVEKLENTPGPEPEYNAPGKQYASARESLAHMVSELKNPQRDSYNATLDFTHASLAQMLDMLRQPIYQHGLALNQELIKARDADSPTPFEMKTTFHHIPTGTEVHSYFPAFMKQDKRLDDCQIAGATFTYFRRYGLRGALDITDGDDDADQADAKKKRQQKRARSTFHVCRETFSPRNSKEESILNILVACGEIEMPAYIEQAKSRNPHLMTPPEVSAAMLDGSLLFDNDDEAARWSILNYGLHDTFWHHFYKGVAVDGDQLVDDKTHECLSSERVMAIAKSLCDWAASSWQQRLLQIKSEHYQERRAANPPPPFNIDCSPLTPEEERFVAVVERGHSDNLVFFCGYIYDMLYKAGLQYEQVEESYDLKRRVWLMACKKYYTECLLRDINVTRFATLARFTLIFADDNEPFISDDMDDIAARALEIATSNADSDDKINQLREITTLCDDYTKGFVNTLIMRIETDGALADFPLWIPEYELPY